MTTMITTVMVVGFQYSRGNSYHTIGHRLSSNSKFKVRVALQPATCFNKLEDLGDMPEPIQVG